MYFMTAVIPAMPSKFIVPVDAVAEIVASSITWLPMSNWSVFTVPVTVTPLAVVSIFWNEFKIYENISRCKNILKC